MKRVKSNLLACTAMMMLGASVPGIAATPDGEPDKISVMATIPSFTDYLIIKAVDGKLVTMTDMAKALTGYDVVFVGEAHGHVANHRAQSDLFAALYSHRNDLALSMEQFERSQQHIVDQYLASEIGEQMLMDEGKAWDHYRSSYRPMVEFAKRKGLPVIAAEVPGSMVSCVGEEGPGFIDRLEGEAKGYIAAKLHTEDSAYKDKYYEFLEKAAGHTVQDPNATEEEKEQKRFNRYAAQVSRDDTMAESIFMHLEANPGRQVMHINGSFHSAGLLGTPERLLMRNPDLKVANVHPVLVDDPDTPSFDAANLGEGEYLLLIQKVPKNFVQMKNISAFIKRTRSKIEEKRCTW